MIEKDLKLYYRKKIWLKGMPLFHELSFDQKYSMAKSLGFSTYQLGKAIDKMNETLKEAFGNE